MGFVYSLLADRADMAGPEKREELDDTLGINVEVFEAEEDVQYNSITDLRDWVERVNARSGGTG